MLASPPQVPPPLNGHELAARQAAGVGMVPHHTHVTPVAPEQLWKSSCEVGILQSASAQDRRIAVVPVRVALVKQLGNVLVALVLPLTMLTDRMTALFS